MPDFLDLLFGLLAAGMVAAIAFACSPGMHGKGVFALFAMITAALTLGGAQRHQSAIAIGLGLGAVSVIGETLLRKRSVKK